MTTDPIVAQDAEDMPHGGRMETPEWLRSQVAMIEENAALDSLGDRIAPIADTLGSGTGGDVLRGEWLGHALHPLLTDLPLGCWLSAGVLDVFGGRSSRKAAKRLVGVGLLLVPPTVATGLADWSEVKDPKVRRVGVVHALGNSVAAMLYFMSWRERRRGRFLRGKALGMLGGTVAIGTGYLGGHMSFARQAGTGERGMHLADGQQGGAVASGDESVVGGGRFDATATAVRRDASGTPLVGIARASELIGVPVDQVETMIDEGMLEVADTAEGERLFREDDVLALRLLGA